MAVVAERAGWERDPAGRMSGRFLIVSALLLLTAGLVRYYPFQVDVPLVKPLADLPLDFSGWQGRGGTFPEAIEKNLGVSEYVSREYGRGDDRIGVYIGYYRSQRAGEQIHSPRHCLPGGGLEVVWEQVTNRQIQGYGPLRAVAALYRNGTDGALFLYWYRMRDDHITNEYLLKLVMIWNSLAHQRNEAMFVRLSAPASGDVAAAAASIDRFLKDFLPVLAGHIPG